MARRSRYSRATTETSSISAPARSMVAGTQESSGVAVVGCTTSASELSPTRASYTEGVPTLWSTPRAVLAFPCGSRSMTSVRSPYSARATPRFTVDVVLPTPPFWLAIVMTRIRLGAGKGSWSAAWSTRVARRASIAIGLSKSARPADDWSAARLLRSRSPGSVIAGPFCMPSSCAQPFHVERPSPVAEPVPRGTAHRRLWAGRSPCSARHDHHGSGSLPECCADGPLVHVLHPGRRQFREHRRQLLDGPRADEGDQPGARPHEPATPADEPGEGSHRPGGDHVD